MKEETISRQSIADKIKELEKERETYVTQANAQISAFNGAISVLENILNPVKNDEDLPK